MMLRIGCSLLFIMVAFFQNAQATKHMPPAKTGTEVDTLKMPNDLKCLEPKEVHSSAKDCKEMKEHITQCSKKQVFLLNNALTGMEKTFKQKTGKICELDHSKIHHNAVDRALETLNKTRGPMNKGSRINETMKHPVVLLSASLMVVWR